MNSKLFSQILYSSFVLLLIIVESLQSPILEDKRTHKLMRFGRATHQMMHFGKRDPQQQKMFHFGKRTQRDIASNEEDNTLNDFANFNEQDTSEDEKFKNDAIFNYLFDTLNGRENPSFPTPDRRSSYPSRPLFLAQARKPSYFKKADNRDNVFMHFG